MLTRAIINSLPVEGDNIYTVRVPLLEDGDDDETILNATVCNNPGTYNAYQVGDAVNIEFLDEKMNECVILGDVMNEIPDENTVYNIMNELKVTGKATLPEDTYIGKYSAQDIFNLYNAIGPADGSGGGGKLTYKLVRIWEDTDE